MVRVLRGRGADPNLADICGITPLMTASQKNSPRLLQLLLEAGAEIDAETVNHHTPLLQGVWFGREQCVQILQ